MTTYYVSSSDVAASDSNAGTVQALPWLTLAKVAATTLVPGDFVLLKRGDYWEEVLTVNQSGTSAGQITYGAYGSGARPMISAANKVTGWTLDQAVAGGDRYYATQTSTSNYCWIDYGANTAFSTAPTQTLSSLQASLAVTDQVGEHFWDVTGPNRLYIVMPTGQVPTTGNTIWASKRNNSVMCNADRDYITVQSLWCRFTNNTSSGVFAIQNTTSSNNNWVVDDILQEWCVSGFKVTGGAMANNAPIAIRNSTFQFNREHGMQPEFHVNSTMDNCVFHGNGRQGAGNVWKSCTVSNCYFTYNANALALWPTAAPQGFDAGLYMVGSEATYELGGTCLITNCVAHHNGKAGFHTDALGVNNTLFRCTSYSNQLYGFFLEGGDLSTSWGNKVYHCVAWNNVKDGLHVGNGHGEFDARNNIFWGNGTDGTQSGFFHEYIIKLTTNWTYVSGTPGTDAVYSRGTVRWVPQSVAAPVTPYTAYTLAANLAGVQSTASSWWYDSATSILYSRSSSGNTIGTAGLLARPTNPTTLDYNSYATSGLVGTIRWPGGPTANFSGTAMIPTLQTATSFESHGFQGNPKYVSAVSSVGVTPDFRLLSGSSCQDTGVVIAGINDGTNSSTRYAGAAPDIGANEIVPALWSFSFNEKARPMGVVGMHSRNDWVEPGHAQSTNATDDSRDI